MPHENPGPHPLIIFLSWGVSMDLLARALAIDRMRQFPTSTSRILGLSAGELMSLGRPSTSGGQQG